MSKTPSKPPKNNAEWARKVEDDLSAQDNATSVRIGPWVLSVQEGTDNLIGSFHTGGSRVIAIPPEPSDDADAVAAVGQPFIKVERQTNQSEARGSTHLVEWDTVAYQTADWGFVPIATDLVVPEDGVYECKYALVFLNSSTAINKGVFMINAVVRMAQEYDPDTAGWYQTMYMNGYFPLNAGDVISCGAFVNGSGTFDFGASGADPNVFTSLSLLKQSVD